MINLLEKMKIWDCSLFVRNQNHSGRNSLRMEIMPRNLPNRRRIARDPQLATTTTRSIWPICFEQRLQLPLGKRRTFLTSKNIYFITYSLIHDLIYTTLSNTLSFRNTYPVLSKDIARLTLDSLGFQKVFRFHNIPKSCYLYYYVL